MLRNDNRDHDGPKQEHAPAIPELAAGSSPHRPDAPHLQDPGGGEVCGELSQVRAVLRQHQPPPLLEEQSCAGGRQQGRRRRSELREEEREEDQGAAGTLHPHHQEPADGHSPQDGGVLHGAQLPGRPPHTAGDEPVRVAEGWRPHEGGSLHGGEEGEGIEDAAGAGESRCRYEFVGLDVNQYMKDKWQFTNFVMFCTIICYIFY
jgi:hypothetical protein